MRVNQGVSQREPRVRREIHRRFKFHFLRAGRMLEFQRGGMQAQARERRAAVKRITQHGKPIFRRVNADLMCAAGERRRFHQAVGTDVRRL